MQTIVIRQPRYLWVNPTHYSIIKNNLGNSFPGLLATSQRARVCRMHMHGALRMFVPQLRSATASGPITAISPYTIRDIRVILLINDVQPVCQNKFLFSTHINNMIYFHLQYEPRCKWCWTFGSILISKVVSDRRLNPCRVNLQSAEELLPLHGLGSCSLQGLGWKLEDASAHLQHPETYHRRHRALCFSL